MCVLDPLVIEAAAATQALEFAQEMGLNDMHFSP